MTVHLRRMSALLALVVMTFGLGLPSLAAPQPVASGGQLPTSHVWDGYPQAAPYGRYEGGNRYTTAVRISQAAWPYAPAQLRPEAIYLARGDVFADALAAGTLRHGQVLLVPPACRDVPQEVLAEIRRTGAPEVVALGGPTAVCDEALEQAAQGLPTRRISGTNRYGTAAAISREAFRFDEPVAELYVASAADSPDAVAGGVLTRGPILLVPPTGVVSQVVLDEVKRLQPEKVIALGGTSVVSDAVLRQVAQGRATDRLAGKNRYDTAAAIARHEFPRGGTATYLARGDVFADAIAGGSLKDGPVLLVPRCGSVPGTVGDYLRSTRSPDAVMALGATGAVCDDTLIAAASLAAIQVAPATLPDGVLGQPYRAQLEASNATAPVQWSATGLPAGLSLHRQTGLVSGTPTTTGTFDLGISTSDPTSRKGWLGTHLTVLP